MQWLRRIGIGFVAVVAVVALVGGVIVVRTVRASWPQTAGTLDVRGLNADVRVQRDARGVPQIYATTDHDLFFAQGFVHAQDRFWEMDFRRHVTAGRLSELFGASEVKTDEFLRTLGWRRVAQQELALLRPETVRLLQAYADGVNAWLAQQGTGASLSLEYAILGLKVHGYVPERWTPVDSLAWLKAMAWDLRGNLDEELARTIAAGAVGTKRAEELYPAYPFSRNAPIVTQGAVRNLTTFDASAPTMRATAGTAAGIAALIARMPAYFGVKTQGTGSNSWVVSGRYTATGKPLLANDPHLAPAMPSIWTQVGLHCVAITPTCSFDVAGWSFSGFPGVIIGHNANVGWGFTNLGPDVSDLVLEDVRGNQVRMDGTWHPLTIVPETITVAGAPAVHWLARATVHGPLISDASSDYGRANGGKGYAVALRWTALTPGRTADAVFLLDRAHDWTSFRAAARSFEVPAQNLVYADTKGNIGYQAPGRIPIRRGYDGRWPVPGWDSRYDWVGYIPFDALPSVLNPKDGFVVTANQAVIDPATYPYFLTTDWAYGSRSQRIRDVLTGWIRSGHRITVADMQHLQMDSANALGPILVPALIAADPTHSGVLRTWQQQGMTMAADSAGAALFAATWRHLLVDVFRDELPKAYGIDGQDRWFEVMRTLLTQPTNRWWDDVHTAKVETRDDMLRLALSQGIAELTARFGSDPTTWRWGTMHTLTLTNQSFGTSGIGIIERIFNRGPLELAGSSSVVDATSWTSDNGYAVDEAPSMRQVLDVGNWDRSTWVNLTGESGHAYSAHYVDQADAWATGHTYPWPFSSAAVGASTVDTLTLRAVA